MLSCQMFIKGSQMSPKVARKVVFTNKVKLFKIAQKVNKYFGLFCNSICCLNLSGIAQSGLFLLFSLFQTNIKILTTNICEKML